MQTHQLSLGKYPIIYRVLAPSQVVFSPDFWTINSRSVAYRAKSWFQREKNGVQFIFPIHQGWVKNYKMQPPASYGKKIPTTPRTWFLFIPRCFSSIWKNIAGLKKNHDSNHVKIRKSIFLSIIHQNPKMLESRRVFVPSCALPDWTIDICTHNEGLSPRGRWQLHV